jgi:outer membrane lipoprotein-sorting protein
MTHWKPKLIAAVAALLLAAVPSTAAPDTEQTALSPHDLLTRMWVAYAALSSYSDEVKSVSFAHEKTTTWHTTVKLARPNLYLVEWQMEAETPPGSDRPTAKNVFGVWSQGDGAVWNNEADGVRRYTKEGLFPFTEEDMTFVPFAFFGKPKIHSLLRPDCCRAGYQIGPDEKVGDVECYVLHGEQNAFLTRLTLWIGKSDFLLRQVRIVTRHDAQDDVMTQTHSNIVMNVPMSSSDFATTALK